MNIVILGAGAWGTALAVAASRAVRPADARTHDAPEPTTLGRATPRSAQAQPAHHVTLWARDPAQALAMQSPREHTRHTTRDEGREFIGESVRENTRGTARENVRYLPGVALPPSLQLRADPVTSLAVLVADADLVIVATPMGGLRSVLHHIRDCAAPVAWLCKGFEPAQQDAAIGGGVAEVTAPTGTIGLDAPAALAGSHVSIGPGGHSLTGSNGNSVSLGLLAHGKDGTPAGGG